MNVNHFAVEPSGCFNSLDQDDFLSQWNDGKGAGTFWIDIDSFQPDELKRWLATFELPSTIVERCLNLGRATVIIPFRKAVYFESTTYADAEGKGIASIGVICLHNLLITVHPKPVHVIQRLHRPGLAADFKANDISQLLVFLLLVKADEASRQSEKLSNETLEVDERLDRDPDSVSAEGLLDLKQVASDLVRVTEEQEAGLKILAEVDTDVLDFSQLGGTLELVMSVTASVNRRADRLAIRVSDLRNRFQMAQQDRTNHRLAALTIISAVFLPLTLIAGIWGMNFKNMPELNAPYGYFLGLGFMAVIAGILTWYFKRGGWFD